MDVTFIIRIYLFCVLAFIVLSVLGGVYRYIQEVRSGEFLDKYKD